MTNLGRVAADRAEFSSSTPPQAALSPKKRAVLGVAVALGIGAIWGGYHWLTVGRFIESTDDAYVGGNVTPIAPHVSGFVAQILVADNQYVHADQPLIRLDDRDFQAAVDHATAILGEKQAALASLQAKRELQQLVIRQARADLDAKNAEASFALKDSIRYRQLAQVSASSKQSAEKAASQNEVAQSAAASSAVGVNAAKQQLTVLDAQIMEAQAAAAQAQADLHTAQLNLSYTNLKSPIDGYIGNRAAEIGAYVSEGTYLLTVIPAHNLWIDANFKEDQLRGMAIGQSAAVVADVLPDHTFHGHVISLAPGTGAVFSVIPPENATGNFTKIVQRVPVRIVLDADESALHALRPGLSTTVHVDTHHALDKTP